MSLLFNLGLLAFFKYFNFLIVIIFGGKQMTIKQNVIYTLLAILFGLLTSFVVWLFLGTVEILTYIQVFVAFTLIHCLFFYIGRKVPYKKIIFIPSVLLFAFSLILIAGAFIEIKLALVSFATAFAMSVLPQPGGP
mgnify:CR=1 FL=1